MRSEMGNFEEERLGKSYDLKLLRRLYPFVRPYGLVFYLAVFLLGLISLLELSIPYVTKEAIDRYIVPLAAVKDGNEARAMIPVIPEGIDAENVISAHPDLFIHDETGTFIRLETLSVLTERERALLRYRDLTGVGWAGLLLLGIVAVHFFLSFFQKLIMETAGQKIMHDLRMKVFNHIQSLSLPFFNRNPVGRLVTRSTNDIQNMQEMFSSVIIFVFKDLFLIIGIAVVLFWITAELALISFAVLPFVALATAFFAHYARDVFRELRVKVAQINTRFSETIQGMRVVQLFRYERENHARFAKLNHENYLAGIRQLQIFAVFMPVVELLSSVALALIIFHGGKGVMDQAMTLGTLVAFISYMKMFFRPIRDLAEKYNILQNAMSSAERIFLILDSRELEGSDKKRHRAATSMDLMEIRHVEFCGVSFGYQAGVRVLEKISFVLKQGQTLAVVGPTGAGKTSLIHLLVRFYDPLDGQIRFNFINAPSYNLATLRSRIALVTQDPFLFSGSVRENILGNEAGVSDPQLRAILEAAHCAGFVDRLPMGVDTPLFEGGVTLSSGERQLISIARAIARDPDLIVLDEATSYIDTESEIEIQAALDHLMEKRTSVIIAHRISTARHADHILVLKKGRVVEQGDHHTLIAMKGLYYRLNTMES